MDAFDRAQISALITASNHMTERLWVWVILSQKQIGMFEDSASNTARLMSKSMIESFRDREPMADDPDASPEVVAEVHQRTISHLEEAWDRIIRHIETKET